MIPKLRRLLPSVALFTVVLAVTLLAVDGPLTNFMNLRGRTDASGYLITTGGVYTAPDGPLTAMANLRARTDANGYLLTTMNGVQTIPVSGITTTSTDGLTISNATASTSGVPVQMSPRLKWCGSAYNSTSTLSETDCMFAEVLPATVAGTTTQTWKLGSIINGGAATYPFTVDNSGNVAVLGSLSTTLNTNVSTTGGIRSSVFGGNFHPVADGIWAINNNAASTGIELKADALPTVASGFGTSPAITAGSTPLAGSVNVGTGGVATSGVINFNGTAFPSAPFCIATPTTTNAVTRASASTTVLTLSSTTAWTASDVIQWHCISSK